MSDDFTLTHPTVVLGRGEDDGLDFYETPRWCTELLLRHAHKIQSSDAWTRAREVLDPAAGQGAILDVFREHGFNTLGLELDPTRAEIARSRGHKMGTGDALERSWPRCDLAVANPPYNRAEAFVRRAVDQRRFDRLPTYTLLRLSFLEPTESRRDLLAAYQPDVLILPRRPAFDGKGTDSITSAWFVWPGSGRLVWLPP